MAAKQQKPTKQQLAQAKLRAAASGIKMDQSAKGLRNAGKAIAAGAALLPAGRGVKAAATAAKAVKAAKAAKAAKSSRQAYDYVVSGKSAKSVVPKLGTKSASISENVSIKNATSPSGKVSIGGGANQVSRENLRIASLKYSNAEAKANARGLKAANKPKGKKMSSKDIKKFEKFIDAEVKKIK